MIRISLILLCINFLLMSTCPSAKVVSVEKKFLDIERPVVLQEPSKLMIVTHPDDDSIFGGNHLINDNYLVVCVTCGAKANRLQEFTNAMNYTNDEYKYLSHTDLINVRGESVISKWENEYDTIKEELKSVIDSKKWGLIVTHNPDGEYGHIQHKMVNEIVTSLVDDKTKLYYFGKYHEKTDLTEEEKNSINSDKMELLSIYKSQYLNENNRHIYMFKNEDWIKYEEWYSE